MFFLQAGFGWTNGLVLWIASNYGNKLNAPDCPLLTAEGAKSSSASLNASPVMWIMAVATAIIALL
jgi:alpha,alpha-trehalase